MPATVDVVTPADQEGTEAVVLRWFKQVGETVKQHEPLLELETDKVTVEVPAPASGTLLEVLRKESESVEPGAILGRIAQGGAVAAPRAPAAAERPVAATRASADEGLLSPAVRRLLTEHGLKAGDIQGTGKDGRITALDIARHIEARATARPERPPAPPSPPRALVIDTPRNRASDTSAPRVPAAESPVGRAFASRQVAHSPIRRRIATHMVASMTAAPHVTTLFEADMTRVSAHRQRHAAAFETRGAKLTFTAYFVAAAVKALQVVPEVNSTFHADSLEIFSDANIGVGTALGNEGLIVPVIHRAQTLDLFGIAARLNELVNAARDGKLSPDAVRGGTFTISNHGVSGSLLAAPIVINQPQIAIMGVGKIERRPVVLQVDGADAVVVRPMCYLTLTIDHRALDAFQANAFLSTVVGTLQSWPES
ncbi:MAG TPA: 2-oxo acid dehydrogenase subunit E2 [Steroidobacteraceae bacterium]|jgi:2-oxoglutarate dehydrogenase E2 component (dihydrolipoamide succinyltransferase)|nr:2-oxo acid dehydrogenase subunit E2 [Steroidobacteraceae bacterium]